MWIFYRFYVDNVGKSDENKYIKELNVHKTVDNLNNFFVDTWCK